MEGVDLISTQVVVSFHCLSIAFQVQRWVRRSGGRSGIRDRRQDAGDILPDHPTGPVALKNAKQDECEVAARVRQTPAESGDAEGLAGGACDNEVRSKSSCIGPFGIAGHVAEVRDLRPVVRQHGAGKGFDLREGERLPSKGLFPGDGGGLDAGADGEVVQGSAG